MIYVAMFDEVDEGTAIFKCVNDVPNGEQSTFINFKGLPNDFYLKLVGKGAKLIWGEYFIGREQISSGRFKIERKKGLMWLARMRFSAVEAEDQEACG